MWKETSSPLPHARSDDWTKPVLTLAVEDWDEISSADAMGTVDIPLTPDHAITRDWYTLAQNDKGLPKEVSGEVNVVLQWRYNPDLDYDLFSEPIDHPEEELNELRLAIVQARAQPSWTRICYRREVRRPLCGSIALLVKKSKKTAVKKKTLGAHLPRAVPVVSIAVVKRRTAIAHA